MSSAAGASLAPWDVIFEPVSPRLVTARLIVNGAADGVLLVAATVLAVLVTPWLAGLAIAAVALAAWEAWLVPRQVRALGYALEEDHLLWRRGVMFRRVSVIPYGRMQLVEVSQGPLASRLGIAEVRLHTASASTDATINGLPLAEAERLRQVLSERGEERMAGL